MIDNFDDFNYCRDRVDELLRKLDDALDKNRPDESLKIKTKHPFRV